MTFYFTFLEKKLITNLAVCLISYRQSTNVSDCRLLDAVKHFLVYFFAPNKCFTVRHHMRVLQSNDAIIEREK